MSFQLEQMELEVQSMAPELKSKYANRVRSYQVELKRLKQEYVSYPGSFQAQMMFSSQTHDVISH